MIIYQPSSAGRRKKEKKKTSKSAKKTTQAGEIFAIKEDRDAPPHRENNEPWDETPNNPSNDRMMASYELATSDVELGNGEDFLAQSGTTARTLDSSILAVQSIFFLP